MQNGSNAQQDLKNASVEVRHDLQVGQKHWLSGGFSVGNSRLDQNLLLLPPIPVGPTFRSLFEVKTRTTQLYLRDEWKLNERLSLTGEVQYQKARAEGLFTVLDATGTQLSATTNRLDKGAFLPNLVMDYRPNKHSQLRFRARRLFGSITDFSSAHSTR